MKKKLSSRKGETILETLIALLIIVVSISFLTTAIIKSNSILRDVKKVKEKGFSYDNNVGIQGCSVSAEAPDGSTITIIENNTRAVNVYQAEQYEGSRSSNLYYYYYLP